MSEYILVTSVSTGKQYKISHIKEYRIEQSIDIAADSFEFILPNIEYQTSSLISSGDKVEFFINNLPSIEGYIDDIDLEYTISSNDIRITGRDLISVLLDNDSIPVTYNNIGLSDYIAKILPKYNIDNWYCSDNTKFKKIVVSPGENEYGVIERLSKERNIIPMYMLDTKKLYIGNRISSNNPSYIFSNDLNNAIRIKDCQITISNDIRNEVIVYGGDFEKNKNIKGTYIDEHLKTKKRKVLNESDIEKSSDALKRAKEEFYNINRNALSVQIRTVTKNPIYINKCARIKIERADFDAYLLTDTVTYTKNNESGSVTDIVLKLMPGVKVSYKNNDIPLLPKL